MDNRDRDDLDRGGPPILFWGAIDPLYRASSVSVEETIHYYRNHFKTRAKGLPKVRRSTKPLDRSPAENFTSEAATALVDVLKVFILPSSKKYI
jgi:hypothetical protein